MTTVTATTRYAGAGRVGRPLVFSLTETLVFLFIAAALVATAAVPAMIRHPHTAQAQTVSSMTAPAGR